MVRALAFRSTTTALHELVFHILSTTLSSAVRDDGTTRLAHGKKSKEDTFGQNDEDWMVYRAIVSLLSLVNDIYSIITVACTRGLFYVLLQYCSQWACVTCHVTF